MNNTAILRSVHPDSLNDIYRHIEGNTFKNLTTSIEGNLTDGQARKSLRINTDATLMLNKYHNIEVMINKLKLKIEINESN